MLDTTKQFSVIVPKTLTWDKFTALYLFVTRVLKTTLDQVELLFEDQFGSDSPLPDGVPDIDVRDPYNRGNRFGSATQRVAAEAGIAGEPAVKELVTLLNRNNENGFLKSFPYSLVWLIRELYEVGHSVDAYTHRRQVIELMWPVLDTYFGAAEVNLPAVVTIDRPFTMDGYIRLMEIRGFDDDQIEAALYPLDRAFGKAETRRQQARERAKAIEPRLFTVRQVDGSLAPGHLIETDDQKVAGPYFKASPGIALLVVRMRSGRYAIFCRGRQNMRPVFNALEAVEPGKWFLDERPQSPLVLNGSQSRNAEPSQLSPTEIVELIQSAHVHNPASRW